MPNLICERVDPMSHKNKRALIRLFTFSSSTGFWYGLKYNSFLSVQMETDQVQFKSFTLILAIVLLKLNNIADVVRWMILRLSGWLTANLIETLTTARHVSRLRSFIVNWHSSKVLFVIFSIKLLSTHDLLLILMNNIPIPCYLKWYNPG